jgi:hypothetical protein
MYRGRGRGTSSRRGGFNPSAEPSRPRKFATTKDDHMQTAKSINQVRDRKLREAEDAEYLDRPPPGKELINVRLPAEIIPYFPSDRN